ncbi:MAG: relaxase domain-containing protein [Actinomycetes bacterium]
MRGDGDAAGPVFRDGCDPVTGAPLGRGYAGRLVRPVAGFDLTFTIPKSASVLWALAQEPTRRAVAAAHHAAVAQSLEFVDDQVVRTRVGAGGRRQIRTLDMVAAAFDHYGSYRGRQPVLRADLRGGLGRLAAAIVEGDCDIDGAVSRLVDDVELQCVEERP